MEVDTMDAILAQNKAITQQITNLNKKIEKLEVASTGTQGKPQLHLTLTTVDFVQTTNNFIEEARANFHNHESSIRNLKTQMGQIAKKLSTTLPKAFPSDTEVNSKGECKAINLRSGKIVQGSNQGDSDKQVDQSSQPKSLNEAHEPTRQQPTLVKGKENHIPLPQQ
ncbi:hypothetical protein PIB30_078649 [Stylosanthes scabra]|uniref:Uncharacterized protein n=1 Tax=Stylosanthes scabra TaxID=79078 RepID=A0ABU6ZPL4_9FABA|nr:hypothetical protein [Stylosanthes scabra]